MAAFLRERYFCTFYDAIRAMLPGGLWFHSRNSYSMTEDLSWKDAVIRQKDAMKVLSLLSDLGGSADEDRLRQIISREEDLEAVIRYLVRKKWVTGSADFQRRIQDRTEKIATLASSPEEAMEYASHRPKSAAMQRSVLELLCSVGSAAVKEICY